MPEDNSFPSLCLSAFKKIFKCSTHTSNISRKLQLFYEQGQFFDIVLIAGIDNVKVQAHRFVLSASSEYFTAMFRCTLNESNADEVQLKTFDGDTLKLILGFMYTASIEICSETVESLLKAADFLQMDSLITACCDFMRGQLDLCNCLGIALYAELHNDTALYEKAFAFACTLFEKVSTQSDFFKLNVEQVSKFLSSDYLCVASEESLFLCLLAWIDHDKESREQFFISLLSHVRYTFLKPKFIIDHYEVFCKTNEGGQLINTWLKWHFFPDQRSERPTVDVRPRKTHHNLVVLSGYETEEFEFQTFNLALNQWSRADWPRPPKKIAGYGAIVIDKKLILVGGELDRSETNCVDCLDLETMEWSELPPMEEARRWPELCEIHGQLYVLGGEQFGEYSCAVERFDFATRTWVSLAPFPIDHNGIELAVLDGLLYVVCNEDNRLDCYDPATNEWSQKASKYTKIKNIGMSAVKGHLYVVGGSYNPEETDVLECYDPIRNFWTTTRSAVLGRSHVHCASFNDRLICCGGFVAGDSSNLVDEYDPETDEWRNLTPMLPHDLFNFVMAM